MTPRTPSDISADLTALREGASLAFVPMDLVKAIDLCVEFAASVSALIEAADKPAA